MNRPRTAEQQRVHLQRNRCFVVLTGLLLVALLLAGCAGSGRSAWVPQQDFAAQNHDPRPELSLPGDGTPGNAGPTPAPSGSAPSGPRPSGPIPSGSAPSGPIPSGPIPSGSGGPSSPANPQPTSTADPAVVATGLNQPTGLVVLPDGTALVGERTTGRILRVQPQPGQPARLVQTLTGLDASGDGGLLDLALSPTYDQDSLIYAYLTTPTDNRVVHFSLGTTPTPVLTGIPKGTRDNSGRIAFDGSGALLIGTGDAGQPQLATAASSLAGKILRTDDIGRPMADNPDPTSPVFASGLRTVDGLCVDTATGTRIAISAARADPGTRDEINIIKAGRDYGWPSGSSNTTGAAATLPAGAAGGQGCALSGNQLAVATTDGRALVTGAVSGPAVAQLAPTLVGTYGRLRTVVAAADGSIWLTTSNRDGVGRPIAEDDRVIRLDASVGGSIL